MLSTMQDFPLSISAILRHGERVYPESECVTWTETVPRRASFAEVGANAARLAHTLARLGIENGDRVGTFCWNTQEHLEAYLAVPSMGAVLHTLEYPALPRAARLRHQSRRRQADHRRRLADPDARQGRGRAQDGRAIRRRRRRRYRRRSSAVVPGAEILRYSEIIASRDRRRTSGPRSTNGRPPRCVTRRAPPGTRRVSRTRTDPRTCTRSRRPRPPRSICRSASASSPSCRCSTPTRGGSRTRRSCAARRLVMPGRFLQAEPLTRMIKEERVTFSGAVPTIWADILRYGEEHEIDLSTIRMVVCGGSAVPRSLMEKFEERYGVRIVQGWGMTETSPARGGRRTRPRRSSSEPSRRWIGAPAPAGSCRASSSASSTTRATRCRGTTRPSVRSRSADRGSPAPTTAIRHPRSSTTVGCAPAMSARSMRWASCRSPTAPRT